MTPALMRCGLRWASPAGHRGRLSVLVLHRVVTEPDTLLVETMVADRFDAMCLWLKALFNVLPLDEAVQRLRTGTLPARALSITFDDGYADNRVVALPILLQHGLTATFFVATGFVNGGLMWNDAIVEAMRNSPLPQLDLSSLLPELAEPLKLTDGHHRRAAAEAVIANVKYRPLAERQALVDAVVQSSGATAPRDLMMSTTQILELHQAGMQIGAHTVSHPILATLADAEARREIEKSKQFLEGVIGERVTLFAYPNGKPQEDFNARTVAIARELGFEAAVTTAPGAASGRTDLLQVPRFTPWDRTQLRFALRMLGNLRASPGNPLMA